MFVCNLDVATIVILASFPPEPVWSIDVFCALNVAPSELECCMWLVVLAV